MRYFAASVFVAALAAVLFLGGCCSANEPNRSQARLVEVTQQCAPVQKSTPCFQQQSSPCGQAQTVVVRAEAAPFTDANGRRWVLVSRRTTTGGTVKAFVAIPANVIVCFGNFLRCVLEALVPEIPFTETVSTPQTAPAQVQVVEDPCAPSPQSTSCGPQGTRLVPCK